MASQTLIKLMLFTALVAIIHSPRQFSAEARTLKQRDILETMTTESVELTTREPMSISDSNVTPTPFKTSTMQQIPTTTSEPIREASTTIITDFNNPTSSESHSFTHNLNRSLYEELKATSNFPNFSSFETSSEFMKFEEMKIGSSSEESRSMEVDERFRIDEQAFKNNATKEERHSLNEAIFDVESITYSSVYINRTKPEQDFETTALPAVVSTKKGKYLDMNDNVNASLPNGAEVWALAGMRGIETRRPIDDESSSDVELLHDSLNNTAKNLLDWIEIAKMDNDTMQATSEENHSSKTTVYNDINGEEDPATSENKDVIFITSHQPFTTPSTLKAIVEDNRIEQESENVEFGSVNKTAVNSRIDTGAFAKNHEEKEESAFEIIDPFKKSDLKEDLKLEVEIKTTASSEAFTTDSSELMETTTMETFEATTSIIDSFTIIGEEEESDDIFKRTITEVPPITTEEPTTTVKTTDVPITTTTVRPLTTTEAQNFSVNEIPESTHRYNKSTKSIRATTTESPTEKVDTTIFDNDSFSSTLIPKYTSSSPVIATTQHYELDFDSTTSSTIEIIDDDKFKYSTWLPETTKTPELFVNGNNNEQTTVDSLNKESLDGEETGSSSLGLISAIVSVLVVLFIAGFAFFIYKRRNLQKFSQRCRPVGLDAYSLDNVSVYNSVRRKARDALRMSKRSYGNSAFEDPSLQSNVLDYQSLQDFAKNKTSIQDEFKDIPQVSVRVDEMPENCEDKNRYANVVPLPETRVHLQLVNDEEKSEYINANYVKGPKDNTNYYIATQAPLEKTVPDFWRMTWEQNSKVIIMATDLTENGVERCAEYIPASVVLDNSQIFGDFQVTLKSREVKEKYAVSQLHLKNLKTNTWREIMHLWYKWPENGCPTDESSIISLLLEARGYLRTSLPEHLDENSNTEINKDLNDKEKLSTLDKTKSLQRVQGPLTVHCSPGTGRTGTLIACDIILRMLETPPRQIDIPQIVYSVRRGRANAIRTKDQYEFIYCIANSYAVKLNTAPAEQ